MQKNIAFALSLLLAACTASSGEDGEAGAGGVGAEGGGAPSGSGGSADGGEGGGAQGGGGSGGVDVPVDGWPLGIPVPPFGIDEEAGPFTHYVDNTSPSCSDAGDGTVDTPRCTLPETVPAGSVVEIHGGPYAVPTNDEVYVLDGTETSPVFFRGVGDPVMDGQGDNSVMKFHGTYFVVEGLRFANGTSARLENGHHQALRHSEVDAAPRSCLIMGSDNAVAFDNELHHCHDGGKDRMGIHVMQGTTHNWIIGNHIHHNSSNGIQYSHGAQAAPPDYVFIGANVLNGNRESGLDSKWAGRSVVSGNHIYDVRASQVGVEFCMDDGSYCIVPDSATNGPGVHVGADGYPEEKWVIHNVIHDTNHCIRLEEGVVVRIVGNLCYDIAQSGVNLEKSGPDLVVAHNTFFNVASSGAAGIHQYWRDDFAVEVRNNIFAETGAAALWFESSAVTSTLVFDNNLLWNGGAPVTVRWRNQTTPVSTTPELESLMTGAAQMQGNAVVDPLVTVDDSQGLPVQLRAANSPSVGAADDVLIELDSELKATFGDDVTLIPAVWQGGADIGAP